MRTDLTRPLAGGRQPNMPHPPGLTRRMRVGNSHHARMRNGRPSNACNARISSPVIFGPTPTAAAQTVARLGEWG